MNLAGKEEPAKMAEKFAKLESEKIIRDGKEETEETKRKKRGEKLERKWRGKYIHEQSSPQRLLRFCLLFAGYTKLTRSKLLLNKNCFVEYILKEISVILFYSIELI